MRCAVSGLRRSWETSATNLCCRSWACSIRPSIRFIVLARRPTSSDRPEASDAPREVVLGDGVDLGADPVEAAERPADQQPRRRDQEQPDQRYADPQPRTQARGGLAHGLQAGADVHANVASAGRGSGGRPEAVLLGLVVVGTDDVRDVEAAGGGLGGERRGAHRVRGGGDDPALVVDDLGHRVVGDVDEACPADHPTRPGQAGRRPASERGRRPSRSAGAAAPRRARARHRPAASR